MIAPRPCGRDDSPGNPIAGTSLRSQHSLHLNHLSLLLQSLRLIETSDIEQRQVSQQLHYLQVHP